MPLMDDARTRNVNRGLEPFASEEAAPSGLKEAMGVLEELATVFFRERSRTPGTNGNPAIDGSNVAIPKAQSNNFETMYRILAEQIPAVVFLAYMDEGFGEAYVSPHIETVLGFSQEEWLNDPVRWFKQLHPEDKDRWSTEAAQMFLSGAPLQSTYRVIARDGHVVWFQCDARMIRHDDGRPWLVHGVAFDVTELKESQEALRLDIAERQRLEQELLHAQKMESIGALAGGVAHDFNNILNIILGYSSLLMDDEDPGQARQWIEVIRETAERGAALVQQLLTVARKAAIKFESTDINELLRRFVNLLNQTFPKEMNISLDLNPNLPRIMADPNRLIQALLNLCVNARDAMDGRGNLVLRDEIVNGLELRQRFRDALEDRYVCLVVSDTGPGMDSNIKNRIFDPFFTTKEPGRGTGLGLSAVYAIVRDHHGFINVKSEPDHGTTFHIYLPVRLWDEGKNTNTEIAKKQVEDVTELQETILFVDDEVHQVDLIRDLLEKKGYRVLVAGDGITAVELHRRHKDEIAVVILDLSLPKLNGWEAFLSMRKNQPEVKAIFTTGYIRPDQRSEMINQGVDVIIQKPYLPTELLEELRAAISKPMQHVA
jgi:two-component system, cell cycle sensor histidine kinase and response regulator CckA